METELALMWLKEHITGLELRGVDDMSSIIADIQSSLTALSERLAAVEGMLIVHVVEDAAEHEELAELATEPSSDEPEPEVLIVEEPEPSSDEPEPEVPVETIMEELKESDEQEQPKREEGGFLNKRIG